MCGVWIIKILYDLGIRNPIIKSIAIYLMHTYIGNKLTYLFM